MRQTKIVLFVVLAIVLCTIALTPSEGLSKKAFLSEEEYLKLPEDKIDIAEGALIIAKGVYPELDIQKYLDQIDAMAEELKAKLKGIKEPERIIEIISDYILVKQKLKYKSKAFFLNDLLDKRDGNCHALSTLYLSITERLNLPFYGVDAPGHIFVRYDDGKTRLNVEATDKGKIGSEEHYIKKFDIPQVSIKNGVFLRNLTKKEMLGVLLSNRGLHGRRNYFEESIKDNDRAILVNPKSAIAYNNRGVAYKALGKFQEAINDYNKAIELYPKYASAYENRGNTYKTLRKYQQAVNDYTKAIEFNPEKAKTYYQTRGDIYELIGKHQQAINDYTKVIELDPKHYWGYYNRGLSCVKLGKYEQAINDYTKAIELKPKFSLKAYFDRGLTYSKKGNYQKAVNDFTKAIELNPRFKQAYFYRGVIYGKNLQNYQRAIDDFTTLIKLNPKDISAYNYRGIAFSKVAKYQEAIKDYTKVIELNPKIARVYTGRAYCYHKLGNSQQAFEDYKAAARLGHKGAQAYLKKQGIQW